MRTGLFIAGATLLLAVAIITLVPNASGQAEVDGSRQSRLEKLLEQRRNALTKAVELRRQEYLSGDCGVELVLDAQRRLHAAELDAATTRQDRIAALKKQLEVAKASVAVAEGMFRDGHVSSVDVLLARASSMSVEIRLLREGEMGEAKDN